MKDEIAIQVAYARHLDGVVPTAWLQTVIGWISTLHVLTVFTPEDWSLDDLDPADDASYQKLSLVYSALTEKERSFRPRSGEAGKASGA